MANSLPQNHSELMDGVYTLQRHFYDLTRKYFLFGRDTLLKRANPAAKARVLEVGTGTARNLILLAQANPTIELFGLDASSKMLEYASKRTYLAGLSSRSTFRQGLAESADYCELFGVREGFNQIIFSYSLSMIPDWVGALERAYEALAPGGVIHIVDFWDLSGIPTFPRALLKRWLERFHVQYRPQLLETLQRLSSAENSTLECEFFPMRYAVLAQLRKAGNLHFN